MDANPATILDAIALGVLLLSSVLALTRGFVREALSIGSFVVAALATIFTVPVFRTVTLNWVENPLIATGITGLLVFLAVYIIMTIATQKISGFVRNNPHIGVLDRTAGFAFGLVRGMALLAFILLGWNFLAKPGQTPDWVSQAKVYPAISATAEALKSLAPESAMVNRARKSDPANTTQTPTAKPSEEAGYDDQARSILDQVVTTRLEGEKENEPSETETSDNEDQE